MTHQLTYHDSLAPAPVAETLRYLGGLRNALSRRWWVGIITLHCALLACTILEANVLGYSVDVLRGVAVPIVGTGEHALMILVGLCAGILSGLVGVGGGSVIVPGMELAVGAGDLIARGTSLLVMIPTGIAGTVTNLRHRMVDLRVGLIVGASAAATAPAGRLVATLVSPSVGAILFNMFLLTIIASTIVRIRKKARAQI